MSSRWGPLEALTGAWEGTCGIDWAYSHAKGELVRTPFHERMVCVPFGPILNGRQHLHGLDCRSAMWRADDPVPFHAEVGYWLWDGDSGEILRCFVVRRGITVLAGGSAQAGAHRFTLAASKGDPVYSIAENRYLTRRARSHSYRLTVEVHPDDTWSYDAVTRLELDEVPAPFDHTDRNTLHRAREPWVDAAAEADGFADRQVTGPAAR